jgi:aspartyl-tRNA synthetase
LERTLVLESTNKIDQIVLLQGWVDTLRDHGKILFFDLRDRSGIVQVVTDQKLNLGKEYVVEIEGKVVKRPPKMVNKNIPTGEVEVKVEKIKVLARATALPFPIEGEGHEIDEEVRLKYRYLDLRRSRLTKTIRLRHKIIKYIRDFLDKLDFVEIETPILTKATPEGARDFVVPSRLQPGEFYALPQSPQQYKQLLMVAGFERYYQIARCFRDEDPRADRAYGEFTQLDLEMSFTPAVQIRQVVEDLYISLVKKFFPEKKISQIPFPVLAYDEVMKKYKTDKPDLRKDKNDKNELAFAWIVDFPVFEWKETEKRWDAVHHPFTSPKPEDKKLIFGKNFAKARADQYDFVLNGFEIGGGSIRITDPILQSKIFEIMGHTKTDIQKKFGHLLEAFKYGVPPHGGIAPGIDRFLMVVLNQPSLREVIAFPTNSSGQTAVMQAPTPITAEQLKELHLKITT